MAKIRPGTGSTSTVVKTGTGSTSTGVKPGTSNIGSSSGCCTGSELNLRDLGRTPDQRQMGGILGPLITQGISQGATPFGGQLSASPDQAQMAAMNMMMGVGGQGQYQQQPYPTMGAPGQGGIPVPPWNYNYDSGDEGGSTINKYQLHDPNQPVKKITSGMLRDPGFRNNVPPGSSRHIQGGTSTMTPEELSRYNWMQLLPGLYGSHASVPDPYSSYKVRP